MPELRKKSLLLTGYLSALLSTLPYFRVITPSAPSQRGCQLSLLFDSGAHMEKVFSYLEKSGVVVDERRPDVIRVAPVPMYNTFTDVFVFYRLVKEGLEQE